MSNFGRRETIGDVAFRAPRDAAALKIAAGMIRSPPQLETMPTTPIPIRCTSDDRAELRPNWLRIGIAAAVQLLLIVFVMYWASDLRATLYGRQSAKDVGMLAWTGL